MAKILTEHHPLMKKVVEAMALLDDMNLSIGFTAHGGVIFEDVKTGVRVQYLDLDTSEIVYEFPYPYEFKLRLME